MIIRQCQMTDAVGSTYLTNVALRSGYVQVVFLLPILISDATRTGEKSEKSV